MVGSKKNTPLRDGTIQLAKTKIRFVYDNGVKGVWVNGLEALRNGQTTANKGFRVKYVEWTTIEEDNTSV